MNTDLERQIVKDPMKNAAYFLPWRRTNFTAIFK